ncbi:MAG: ATP-dependent ligase clustered with Ku protein LigD [Ferruginibacter sp.]|nr:ATP-dependent ligase clustered with Ku protein LigD [Ferruginibacter sp.]
MALTKYKEKRSFKETPEPTGGKSTGNELRFVVQKHDASRLHYDFRLEMEGVLKSWAVPKGPSTDPSVKRLAMMVEDHPYDYRTFEGIIPKGQYGGGTVIVWDEGTYRPDNSEETDKKKLEKDLLHQLHSGVIKFTLNGTKLKGSYALVKTGGRGENAWLLIKHKDKYASSADITNKEKSVQSGKTIKQVEKTSENVYGRTTVKAEAPKAVKQSLKKQPVAEPPAEESHPENVEPVEIILKKAKKEKFPSDIAPMLTTLVDEPFDEEGWQYEIKWDGYRAIAYLNKGQVDLRSRNNKSFNEKFYAVYDALKKMKINAVLDGEIIVADDNGMANFGNLQNWRSEADGRLLYYVFDILWLEGKSLMALPLSDRSAILKAYLQEDEIIRLSNTFKVQGSEFYATAEKMGLEGIIAKKSASAYLPGDRSNNWLKIKTESRQEVVIGGFTKNEGSSKLFSSLLVGVYEKGNLRYTGKIGTGFTDKLQKEMMQQFRPLITKTSPFTTAPDVNKPSRFRPDPPNAEATWLKPKLICEVSFREMTSDRVMRHPSFKGMREDKKAEEVVLEKEAHTKDVVNNTKKEMEKKTPKKDEQPIIAKPGKTDRKTFLNPSDETQVRQINGHELKFTNLSKLYWPKDKISKRDMLNYYYQVAPYILPYLKDRPQSLNRHPNGINGMSFYQKDVTGKVPDWIQTFPYTTEGVNKNFMVCNDEASLLYMASLGCIELNPWSSRVTNPDNPDWCIIDLDPGSKNTFEHVIETAAVTKQILDAANIPAYCKTSGSTGLHIYIPLGGKYDYESSKEFARIIARLTHEQLPEFTSIERLTNKRKGKLYIDFLQNRPQATLACAYSLRPKPMATVSMPLHWEEVKKGLQMKDFTIHNAIQRVKEQGDIFSPVLAKGIDINKALNNLKKQFEMVG